MKGVAKAVVPTFILGKLGNQQADGSAEGAVGKNGLATVGVNLALVPGAIELASSGANNSKVCIGLTAYDSAGRQIAVSTDYMTRAARKDWQELLVNYIAEKDGFVEVFASQPDSRDVLVETNRNKNWIKLSVKGSNDVILPRSASASGPSCTAWYWCAQYGCE